MTTTSAGSTSTPACVKSMTNRWTRSLKPDSTRSSPAAPHLEEGLAFNAPVLDEVNDSSGRPIEALAPVAPCFSGGILLGKDLAVALWRAAVAQRLGGTSNRGYVAIRRSVSCCPDALPRPADMRRLGRQLQRDIDRARSALLVVLCNCHRPRLRRRLPVTVAVKGGSIQAAGRLVAKSARGIAARITMAERNQELDGLGAEPEVEIH